MAVVPFLGLILYVSLVDGDATSDPKGGLLATINVRVVAFEPQALLLFGSLAQGSVSCESQRGL